MEIVEVEDTMMVSDISEGTSTGGCDGGGSDSGGDGLSSKMINGVRNCGLLPFVMKLYNMVCNKATDATISWVSNPNHGQTKNNNHGGAVTFAIWNDEDFVANVLPLMSRSNNFDSFLTQLNNYGFKKISWDRREYANEWFQEGKPHLLKNITRRNKQSTSETDKLKFQIKKMKRESKDLDHELKTLQEYVKTTMSNQITSVRDMIKLIKSTFDHHSQAFKTHEVDCNAVTESVTLVGQQGNKTIEIGQPSFPLISRIQIEDELPDNTTEN